MKLGDIKARCYLIDGHWLWSGAQGTGGVPRIWAPDFTLHGGSFRAQTGRRAVWHVKTRAPIPRGWRVFGTCDEPLCLNPAHMVCELVADHGAKIAAAGKWKGVARRIAANRQIGRARSDLDAETYRLVRQSPDLTGAELAKELNVARQTISRARNGRLLCWEPVGGVFTGLLALRSNDEQPSP